MLNLPCAILSLSLTLIGLTADCGKDAAPLTTVAVAEPVFMVGGEPVVPGGVYTGSIGDVG